MSKWKATIDFIAVNEKKFQDNEITLQEMCKNILKGFVVGKWISENPFENGRQQEPMKWIDHDEQFDLEELVLGTLHTIAFMDDIFDHGEELPDIDDYDYWKDELYDWCDTNRVWISPTPIF